MRMDHLITKYLNQMLNLCEKQDYVFGSRYLKEGESDDDTFLTKVGTFCGLFTAIGNIFFSLKLTDILFTFILGKTKSFQSLNLKSDELIVYVYQIPI